MNADHDDMEITLPILESIEAQSDLTQRSLAKRLNLALGLTNSYLKRCIRKGFIKIEQAPANRYFYYLTPKGLAEKSRLAAKYIKGSFHFYRQSSDACLEVFQECQNNGWKRIVLCGVSDLAEIAILQAAQAKVKVVGIYDDRHKLDTFFGVPAWHELSSLPKNPVCVITAVDRPLRLKKQCLTITAEDKVIVPQILRL